MQFDGSEKHNTALGQVENSPVSKGKVFESYQAGLSSGPVNYAVQGGYIQSLDSKGRVQYEFSLNVVSSKQY